MTGLTGAARSRIRFRFARLAPAAGLSHLEQLKVLRGRAATSGLRCCPSKAGGSVPKMAFGPAVSEGHESLCEYADLYLDDFVKEELAADKMSAMDDASFRLLSARRIPVFFPSIEAAVNAAEYYLEGGMPETFSQASVDAFKALETLPFEKVKPSGEKRLLDARAPVLAASWDPAGLLKLTLKLEPGKNIKPEAVAALMAGAEPRFTRITRKELYWMDSTGKLQVF